MVDDEKFLVDSLKKVLEDYGYQVAAETSSVQALELFKQEPEQFDLVVTDQIMPGMTGVELSEGLLAIRPDIPIILCTGFSEIIIKEEAADIGIRQIVQKPVIASELIHIINNILNK